MNGHVEKLKREVEELERQIASHPFESLFDRKRADQLYHKLKKKRKELTEAESGPAPAAPAVAAPHAMPPPTNCGAMASRR